VASVRSSVAVVLIPNVLTFKLPKHFSLFTDNYYLSIRQNDYHTGNWNHYIHCMSGNGTYNAKDTSCTIKLPATSRLVSFADVDHVELPRNKNNDYDKYNDDDRTTSSTSSTSVCNNIKIWKMSDEVANEQTGGVCPIVEAVLFPSVQEFECPASTLDASRWIASNTNVSQELARCTLDVTNNGNSTNHGKVHLIDARGIIACPANIAPPQIGKERETFVGWQGASRCFIKECTRRATCRMKVAAASAVGEKRDSYDGAKVVVKKSPYYHNLDESGHILRFEVHSLVVNVSWQQKEVPFLKFSLLESCAHVL
jgi:hypothetical protein